MYYLVCLGLVNTSQIFVGVELILMDFLTINSFMMKLSLAIFIHFVIVSKLIYDFFRKELLAWLGEAQMSDS
jgi:hypothetical protein